MNRPLSPGDSFSTAAFVEIPFKQTWGEITLEPEPPGAHLDRDMQWLTDRVKDGTAGFDEVERVMKGAAVLSTKFSDEPFSRCLHTALVWEFG